MYDHYMITIKQASIITGFPIRKWFKWILSGLITSEPELNADSIKGISYNSIAGHVFIPVNTLSKYYRQKFLKSTLVADKILSVDLIGYLETYGDEALGRLYEELALIKDFINLRHTAESGKTAKARQYASSQNIDLSTLYRKEALFMQSDLKKLVSPPDHIYHARDMCRLSEDYAKFEWGKPNHLAKVKIHDKLAKEAKAQGPGLCSKCPYNQDSRINAKLSEKYPEITFSCEKSGKGMLYPASKDPFNRFLASVNDQDLKFSREGDKAWEDVYMHFTKRDPPERANAVWFGDHHLADNVVLCGYDKDGKPILKRPWITCNYEAASSAINGSVISIRPNSMTIAEAFCRAAAFTVDSPFFSLPEVYYVDRGKDYKATIIEGRDYDMRQRLEQHYCLNRAFCDNPLLPALNVTVRHALPRTGRSKSIERLFGTITRQYFREIPCWVGDRPDTRPFDYEKELKKLIDSGMIWTLEKFARYWFDVIVPGYNSTIPDGEKESPLQKYLRLEKADTVVPDWNTLTVFMAKKPKHKVHSQGIKYNNELYWHPDLSKEGVMGSYVSIYDFDQTICHSISVIHNGKYLCEAEPLIHQKLLEPDRLKLEQHLEEQKAQKRRISRHVTAVKQILKKASVKANRYVEYEPADDLTDDPKSNLQVNLESTPEKDVYDENPTMYCETIDDERDKNEATILSRDANEITKVAEHTKATMEEIIKGPKSTAFEDYFVAKGEALTGKEQ